MCLRRSVCAGVRPPSWWRFLPELPGLRPRPFPPEVPMPHPPTPSPRAPVATPAVRDRIKLLAEQGKTQAEIAVMTRLSQSSISRILRGKL